MGEVSLYTVQDYLKEYPATEQVFVFYDYPSGNWVACTDAGGVWAESEIIVQTGSDPLTAMTALLATPAFGTADAAEPALTAEQEAVETLRRG